MTAYDHVQQVIEPLIVEALMGVIVAMLAWIGRHVPAWVSARIDQINRGALHQALETGTHLALDAVQGMPQVTAADAAVTAVVAYTRRSVPGAIRHFLPSEQQLIEMTGAKLNEALAARGLDPLSQAVAAAMQEGRA